MGIDSFDVKRVLNQSARKASLEDLQRKGISAVRILDENMVQKLIMRAVEKIIGERTNLLTAHERDKIYRDARRELDALLKEHSKIQQEQKNAFKDRETLLKENENLLRQLELFQRTASEEARRRFEEGLYAQKELVTTLRARIVDLEGQMKEGLLERLQAIAKGDKDAIVKMLEGMSKKVEAIRMRVSPDDVVMRPGAATIEGLLREEVESNLGEIGSGRVSTSASSTMDASLARLKAMRQGGAH